jgi:hypothetical protein
MDPWPVSVRRGSTAIVGSEARRSLGTRLALGARPHYRTSWWKSSRGGGVLSTTSLGSGAAWFNRITKNGGGKIVNSSARSLGVLRSPNNGERSCSRGWPRYWSPFIWPWRQEVGPRRNLVDRWRCFNVAVLCRGRGTDGGYMTGSASTSTRQQQQLGSRWKKTRRMGHRWTKGLLGRRGLKGLQVSLGRENWREIGPEKKEFGLKLGKEYKMVLPSLKF